MVSLLLIGLLLAALGFLAGLLAWILAHFIKKSPEGRIHIRQGGLLTKTVFLLAGGAGVFLGVALVGFVIVAVWWGIAALIPKTTPAGLALFSILVGVAPFLLALLGGCTARLAGGQVDASGARNCFLFGFDLNGLVYVLYMSYWWSIFSGGIAFIGLISSGIWAFFN